MNFDFEDTFNILEDMGISDIWIPFFLIFVIAYAILDRTKILRSKGNDGKYTANKAMNIVVSLVLAAIPIVFHITGRYGDYDVVDIINNSLPLIGLMIVAVLMVMLVLGTFGAKMGFAGNAVAGWVFGLAILFIVNFAVPEVPGWIGLLTIFIIALTVITAKKKSNNETKFTAGLLVFGAMAFVIYIFGGNMGYFSDIPYWMRDPALQAVVIFLVIFGAILAFVTKGEKKKE